MRLAPIMRDSLDRRGREVHDAIAGPRGGVADGPFRVWLASNVELAARMNDVGNALRLDGKLDKRLFEIAVLTVARFWNADYQWAAHYPLALQAGIDRDAIDAIGVGGIPETAQLGEWQVFDLTRHLLHDRNIPQDVYDRVLNQIGFDQMVELITTIGQYSMAAIVTNGFEVQPVDDGSRLPERR